MKNGITILLIAGAFFLLLPKEDKANGIDITIPVPGGKNTIKIPGMPIQANGLPQAIHVYEQDFPIVANDFGTIVSIIQIMLNLNYAASLQVTGKMDAATMAFLKNSLGCDKVIGREDLYVPFIVIPGLTYAELNFRYLATYPNYVTGAIEYYDFKPTGV